jgi:hypothetical protein
VGKYVIEIEMQLRDEADIAAAARVNGNDGFRANLEIFSGPDDTRVDCPSGLAAPPTIERRFEGKLDQWNQVIARRSQDTVLDLIL